MHQSLQQSLHRRDVVLSIREVEGLIADGKTVIIVENMVLKIDAWVPFHPGGNKAILHMVGRDATDEVNALHSPAARQIMKSYQIGTIKGQWKNLLPPIQGGKYRSTGAYEDDCASESPNDLSSSNASTRSVTPDAESADGNSTSVRMRHKRQHSPTSSISSVDLCSIPMGNAPTHLDVFTQREVSLDLSKYPSLDPTTQKNIVEKYRSLDEQIRKEGLYQCNYSAYLWEICRYVFLFSACLVLLHCGYYSVSGIFLGIFWHQLVFTAHDAGHMGITHDFTVDTLIGIFIADFLGGLSLGWWKRNHNVHHIVTNSPEHDPDIEHMPFFMISHRFFASLRSTYYDRVMEYDAFAKIMARYQKYLYYPVMAFGRFNLYRLSWEYLFLGLGPRKGPARWHRWLEIFGQLFFWAWFGYGIVYKSIPTATGRLVFVLASHMITAPLHVQITLSHFAMSTADLGVAESFPQRMLRTTMDVDCPEWLDFFHGGLQFQAVHHLYPRIPRHNLRRTQKLVQEFCREVDIPYALYGFVDGNREVIGRLGEVGRQAAILARCQETMAITGQTHF